MLRYVVLSVICFFTVSTATPSHANPNFLDSEKAPIVKTMTHSQYSDNPTIPGDGTPQRTQGSGTR